MGGDVVNALVSLSGIGVDNVRTVAWYVYVPNELGAEIAVFNSIHCCLSVFTDKNTSDEIWEVKLPVLQLTNPSNDLRSYTLISSLSFLAARTCALSPDTRNFSGL